MEAGRQRLCAVEQWMKSDYKLSQIFGGLQLFCERDSDGRISMIVAKVVDDFIISGKYDAVESFITALSERFELGTVNRSDTHSFLGCRIQRSRDGSIKLSMPEYFNHAAPVHIRRNRRADTWSVASPKRPVSIEPFLAS